MTCMCLGWEYIQMTPRELFEARFPVPDGVTWDDKLNTYIGRGPRWISFVHRWIGFQAGYEAANGCTSPQQ